MNTTELFAKKTCFRIQYAENVPNGMTSLQHFHDAYELDFFVKADIEIFVKDMKYRIVDGDMLFINTYDIHRVFYKPHLPYVRYIINFQPLFLHDLSEVLHVGPILETLKKRRNQKVHLDFKQRAAMAALFQQLALIQEKISDDPDDVTLGPSLKMVLIFILFEFYKAGLTKSDQAANNVLGLKVKETIHYIDKYYKASFKLADLALSIGVNKFYISHQFKEETKSTIVEYLQYRRVIEAQKLLSQTDMPIIEVGMECGFQSLQHFYRIFKKIAKKSPAQYRRDVHSNG